MALCFFYFNVFLHAFKSPCLGEFLFGQIHRDILTDVASDRMIGPVTQSPGEVSVVNWDDLESSVSDQHLTAGV